MRRLKLIVFIVLIIASAGQRAAEAEPRFALVIGNSQYKLISSLTNPKNDAALIASTLAALGFEVTLITDVRRKEMMRAIRDFSIDLREAGSNAVGLFYYAGHGVFANGINYLIPLNALIQYDSDLEIEAVEANYVLSRMKSAGNSANILILDACRNNPFRVSLRSDTRSQSAISNGLGEMKPLRGSIIAFSAEYGEVAFDGRGSNSPYAAALARAMKQPGVPIEQVFKSVRNEVKIATGGRQFPREDTGLEGDFYFIPPQAASTSVPTSGGQAPVGATIGTQEPLAIDKEALFWQAISESEDSDDYQAYLQSFPSGVFAPLARARLEDLQGDVANLQPPPEQPAPRDSGNLDEGLAIKRLSPDQLVPDEPENLDTSIAILQPIPEEPVVTGGVETDQSPDENEIKQAIIEHYNSTVSFARAMKTVYTLAILDRSGDVITVKFKYEIKKYTSTKKQGSPVKIGEATLRLRGSTYEVTQFKER